MPELGNTMTTVQEMPIDSRKDNPADPYSHCADLKQPPSLDDHHYAKLPQTSLATRDPAVLPVPTGEPVHLATLSCLV